MAIYQLPQVTKNEMSPALVAELVERFDNFYLLKDTSGQDRVALAGVNGVFLVRGAEGNYTQHLAANGGRYDGFLLSTANCFGKQLAEVIEAGGRDDLASAETFSRKLGLIFDELAAQAAEVPWGNPFANANKAMDHFFAHGPGALSVPPPMLHAKHRMPQQLIDAAGATLTRHGLMPTQGYLS
jgi:dihydrodipicolinate synthase/N-acetylneuraminate lyase